MEQTIKINVPEGKVAKYNEETQTIEFIDKEPVRSKSWEEFCKNHPQVSYEYYLEQSVTRFIHPTTEPRINFHHNSHGELSKGLLETKEDAEGILALIQLTRLHDEWVGDWKPRYGAHCIYFTKEYSSYIDIGIFNYHRLLGFPTLEMAKEFCTCFSDLILKAKKFI